MSAPKAENGFVGRRIVSSRRGRRNNSNKKASDFNDRRTAGAEKRGSSGLRNQCRSAAYVVSTCGDHGGLGGVGLDLPADSHDSQIDGAITLNARRPDLHVKQQMRLRDLAAPCARVLQNHSPPKLRGAVRSQEGRRRPSREGAGKTGCALHPRSHVQRVAKKTHMSIQVQRKHSGLPCAMVLTACFVLSPARPCFVVTVAPERRELLKNLMPASGHQDHTT